MSFACGNSHFNAQNLLCFISYNPLLLKYNWTASIVKKRTKTSWNRHSVPVLHCNEILYERYPEVPEDRWHKQFSNDFKSFLVSTFR